MLLLADGEWELAADIGEGNRRDWSQEKRDMGASRGFVTLPTVSWGDSEGAISAFPSGIGFTVPLRHKSSAQTSNLSTHC